MEENKFDWTDEQKEVFSTKGKNLLVSASAGSGKTSVMIERIVRLIINEKVPISNFLVVTFTRASANDMKKRLIDTILKQPLNDYLLQQMEAIETSDISTLHVFCSRLIQTYFYEVNIDPNFSIIDDIQNQMVKEKAISRVFEEKEKNGDEGYLRLYEIFQKKRSNEGLKDIVYKISTFLKSIINQDEFIKNTIENSYNLDINKNQCAKIINTYVSNQMQILADEAMSLANLHLKMGEEKAYNYLLNLNSQFLTVNKNNQYFVNAKNLYDINIERVVSINKNNVALKGKLSEFAKMARKKISDLELNVISNDEELIKIGLKQSTEDLKALYSLVSDYEKVFADIKKEMGVLDFNDLETNALKILNNPSIQETIRQKYKYVFVDEYQDVNEIQEEIVSKVASKDNRFMVGDVKQSIYAFRLCDPEIFLSKLREYSIDDELNKVIRLNSNFRSDVKILSFVDTVFSGVMTEDFGGVDYENEAKFVPGQKNCDNPNSVNLCFINKPTNKNEKSIASGVYSVKNHVEENDEETSKIIAEANLVVEKITELTDVTKPDSIKRSDIAILVSSKKAKFAKFVSVLNSYGISVSSGEKFNIMKKPYIEEIVDFVKLCVNQNDDVLIFKVLKSKLFNFTNQELVELRQLDFHARFYDIINKIEINNNANLLKKVNGFRTVLDKFKKLSRVLNLKNFIKLVVEEFKLEELNLLSIDGESAVEDINHFVLALPNVGCLEFVLDYENFSLEIENEFSGDSVKVMTIHSSKGIEFKVVFLVNLDTQINLSSTYGDLVYNKNVGIGINYFNFEDRTKQMTIPSSAIKLLETRKIVEESQRVLYVALTRAKEKLFVICVKDQEKLQEFFPKRPHSFLSWFEPIIYKEIRGQKNKNINFEYYDFEDYCFVKETDEPKLILKKVGDEIEPFKYAFDDYTKIPLKTSVSKILNEEMVENEIKEDENRIDSQKLNSSANRGSAYHKLMQNINLKKHEDIDGEIDKAMEFLNEEEKSFIDKSIVHKILLLPFFQTIKEDDIVMKEREFLAKLPIDSNKNVYESDDNYILQGVVDLLIINENGIIVADYKTGKIDDEKLARYKRQLDIYADVLIRSFNKPIIKKIIVSLDMNKIIEI